MARGSIYRAGQAIAPGWRGNGRGKNGGTKRREKKKEGKEVGSGVFKGGQVAPSRLSVKRCIFQTLVTAVRFTAYDSDCAWDHIITVITKSTFCHS